MTYFTQVKALFLEFCASLRDSRASSRESLAFALSIDRLVVNDRRFNVLLENFVLMVVSSFFGYLMQKVSEGWLAPGRVRIEHVLTFATCSLVFGFVTVWYKQLVVYRRSKFDDIGRQLLDDMEVEKMVSLDVGRITDPEFVELRTHARGRGRYAFKELWVERYQVWASCLAMLGSFAVIIALDVWIVLIMCLPLIPGLLKSILVDKRERELDEALVHPERVRDEYAWCLRDTVMSVQTKLFGFVPRYLKKYATSKSEILERRFLQHRFVRKANILVGAVQRVSFAAVLVYLGVAVVHGEYDLLKLFALFGSARTFSRGLNDISWRTTRLAELHKDYLYLKRILDTEPLLDESGCEEVSYGSAPTIGIAGVRMKYPRQDAYALKDCTLAINPGSRIMIVGKNGCGKTTLLRLISKVFLPTEGEVLLDGVDVRTIKQASLLNYVMYVTQGNRIADFPIDTAVTGLDRDKIDYERLLVASSMLGADEFVSRLPFGYQTQIGVEWPGGVDLSTGQMQRLKLVAAMYRLLDPDVHVGLFDEPMANCDAQTRTRFYSALSHSALRQKTIVVVAHDPLYLSYFQRVVVMDDGHVTHDICTPEEIAGYREKLALNLSADL